MTKLSETLPIEEARERLRQLISELAVVRGKVTLASGKEADYSSTCAVLPCITKRRAWSVR